MCIDLCTKKHVLIFFAGAQAFHTLGHLMFSFSGSLPLTFWGITVTPGLNLTAIALNALVTVGLLWWADKTEE